MRMRFFGATEEVTGSCCLLETHGHRLLIDCGLFQGSAVEEQRNQLPFPFDPASIDSVILSHAHIDHSGRLPLLVKAGFQGPIMTHRASKDLCRIMLKDAGFIHEKNAEWENKKRQRKGMPLVEPLYTMEDAKLAMRRFTGVDYGKKIKLAKGLEFELHDAGHIIGSSIIKLRLQGSAAVKTVVFSGDLGKANSLLLKDPATLRDADLVVMESTYGDRLHRSREDTLVELRQVFKDAAEQRGNILIPSFAVGRSQELLYLFSQHYNDWNLSDWHLFLDSPMAIEATAVYSRHKKLQNKQAADIWVKDYENRLMPNLHFVSTPNQSMNLNRVNAGAVIIAGSGMCTGGRIRHHLKHNIWRRNCHVIIIGFQARGTPGRALVDGAKKIRLWGETIQVAAQIHTIGGLSAHADQQGLLDWYGHFENQPELLLVHGEPPSMQGLTERLKERYPWVKVHRPRFGQTLDYLY